jgi:hypothetical protein
MVIVGPTPSRGRETPYTYLTHVAKEYADMDKMASPLERGVCLQLYCVHFPLKDRAAFEQTMMPGGKPGQVCALFSSELLGQDATCDDHDAQIRIDKALFDMDLTATRVLFAQLGAMAIPYYHTLFPGKHFSTVVQVTDREYRECPLPESGSELQMTLLALARPAAVLVFDLEDVEMAQEMEHMMILAKEHDESEDFWRDDVPRVVYVDLRTAPLEPQFFPKVFDKDRHSLHFVFVGLRVFHYAQRHFPEAQLVAREYIECRRAVSAFDGVVPVHWRALFHGDRVLLRDTLLLHKDQVAVEQFALFDSPDQRRAFQNMAFLPLPNKQ